MLMSRPTLYCLFVAFMQEDTELLVVMVPRKLMQLRVSSSHSCFTAASIFSIGSSPLNLLSTRSPITYSMLRAVVKTGGLRIRMISGPKTYAAPIIHEVLIVRRF